MEDGVIKSRSRSTGQGVGVRAVSDEKAGVSYSDDSLLPVLTQGADAAGAVARSGASILPVRWTNLRVPALYSAADPLRRKWDPKLSSYRVASDDPDPKHMERPF